MEFVKTKEYEEACNYFSKQLFGTEKPEFGDDKYIQKNSDVLIEAYENKLDMIDFDCWTHLQDLLGQKLTLKEYEYLCRLEDEMFDEILEISEDDEESIEKIKKFLKEFK
jgi:hypothetical protein